MLTKYLWAGNARRPAVGTHRTKQRGSRGYEPYHEGVVEGGVDVCNAKDVLTNGHILGPVGDNFLLLGGFLVLGHAAVAKTQQATQGEDNDAKGSTERFLVPNAYLPERATS